MFNKIREDNVQYTKDLRRLRLSAAGEKKTCYRSWFNDFLNSFVTPVAWRGYSSGGIPSSSSVHFDGSG